MAMPLHAINTETTTIAILRVAMHKRRHVSASTSVLTVGWGGGVNFPSRARAVRKAH
jgi:hypothetical protein